MTYAFDPELVPWIEMLPQTSLTDVELVRQSENDLMAHVAVYEPSTPLDVRDLEVPGPQVPVRVYKPAHADGPLPGLLYIHGGGFVLGNVAMFDSDAARIAAEVGAVVVSVEYRLAPEHPFPAGFDDCYAALLWTAAQAAQLGIDLERLGVGGESAGGGLAAAVALAARDRGGPALCLQLLGIPELDDRLDTVSMRAFTDTPLWSRHDAELSWDYYLGVGVRGTEGVSQYAAPARAEDLSGLPRAYVTTCEFDPLRDEGLTYAQRLLQAGVSAELHHYPGTFHGSALFEDTDVTQRMIADQLGALRRGLRAALPTSKA